MKYMMAGAHCTKSLKLFFFVVCMLGAVLLIGSTLFRVPRQTASALQNEQVTVRGTIGCLPWRDSIEVHTMECALGLEDAAGTYYVLRDADADHPVVSTMPTGVLVEAVGIFTYDEGVKYRSIGVLDVSRMMLAAQ